MRETRPIASGLPDWLAGALRGGLARAGAGLGESEEEIQKERGRGDPVGKRLKFGGDTGFNVRYSGWIDPHLADIFKAMGRNRGLLDFTRPAGRGLGDGVASGRRREPELDLAFAGERDLLALGALWGER